MRRRGDRVDRAALVTELVGLVPVAGWGTLLGDVGAAATYARVVELAGLLGLPSPPPAKRLAGPGSLADEWLTRCGVS